MAKRVTRADLRDGQAYGILLCPKCGGEYSADRRDYWAMPPSKVFTCCGINCRLVRKVTRYVPVSA